MKTAGTKKLHAALDIREQRNEIRRDAPVLLPLFFSLSLLFTGCSSIIGDGDTNHAQINSIPTSDSEQSIQDDIDSYWTEKSIVLFQLDTSWNGKPLDALQLFPGDFQFALANLDTGAGLKQI